MLICPDCGHELTVRPFTTDGGVSTIDVDWCSFCGGTFFDRLEINRFPYNEALKLGKLLPHVSAATLSGTGECPKCHVKMERLTGEAVPHDVHALHCNNCDGTWFATSELEKFKKAQEARISYYKVWKIPLPSLHAVLIPVATIIVLSGATFITVREVQKSQISRTQAEEIITTPSVVPAIDHKSATIIFTTRKEAATTLIFYYQKPLGKTMMPISQTPSITHQITIKDLQPGKTYEYQVKVLTGEDSFTTREYSFQL